MDGARGGGFFERGGGGVAGEFDVVLDGDAVVFDGDAGVGVFLAVGIPFGGGEVDVVGLPSEGREAEVLAWGGDFVEATAFVVFAIEPEAIEHLNFVTALEVNAAVATGLAASLGHEGQSELDVKGEILEEILAGDALHEQAVVGDAGFWEAIDGFAVEQHGGIWWWWCVLGRRLAAGADEFKQAGALGVEDLAAFGGDFGTDLAVGGYKNDLARAFIAAADGAGHAVAIAVPAIARQATLVADGFKFALTHGPNLYAPAAVFERSGELALDGEVGVFFGGFCWSGVGGKLGFDGLSGGASGESEMQ